LTESPKGLSDGAGFLLDHLATLFNKVYFQRKIPPQWLVAKTIPVYKNKDEKEYQ
jgi:hypothetical protein